MITIEKTDIYGWEAAIRGMRNPMNSWDKSDSMQLTQIDNCFKVGTNDLELMKSLAKAGTDHAKYRRMINVTADITAPLYWWKEFDTYKVGTVANSCSTMHKIAEKEFTMQDFSCEHLLLSTSEEAMIDISPYKDGAYKLSPTGVLARVVHMLNHCRNLYLETKDKKYWWQMIQLLPSSYNQKRTVQLNYEVLSNIYHSRKEHKLDEWLIFCSWIRYLPYSEIITGEKK